MKSLKFNPARTRYRATFAGSSTAQRLGKVDRENELLSDVQITLEGEAKGHGVWLDREFCEAVAEAGNKTGEAGLKVRYGHPSMCSDAIGTELGRARNFRVVDVERQLEDGSKVTVAGVIADVQILKSAHEAPQGDIAAHVISVAEEDPTQFGQSIVFTYADFVVKDKDGVRHSYKDEVIEGELKKDAEGNEKRVCKSPSEWEDQSADGKVYAVLGKLHGSDFTDTPAATDGIFSTGTLAEEAEQMLEEHPEIFDAIEKSPKSLVEFLERTGLDKKLDSARVAGLQAAKDKQIAELTAAKDATVAELTEKLEKANAAKDRVAELEAKVTNFEADDAKKSEALEALGFESVEQLATKYGEVVKELSETKAALAAEIERYREQVGAAMHVSQAKPTEGLSGREKALVALRMRAK